ncbi:bifunctional 3-deoxy-7-phosphoheptulonate synthase/chorismate mutase type II [bacterium SCSIO 12643]|nr:bifunctional 3-deoxy-7-phosphoheptulonate synthase/chorismate mutase type II [bacterium SCSIO 12643]
MTSKLDIDRSNGLPNNKPIIISGPCSAESPEQLMSTAKELANSGKTNVLRAGVWKPRTRPNAFEGIGEEALRWLADAGKETELPTSTEVATAEHVESALKAGIDILWIGARTTTNPFSVQAIADSLRGVDIPIMVKNPINPDINLWVGALERINRAGITKLSAIHRGFSTFHQQYRNAPLWDIPLKLKMLFPDMPLINDPSHISGSRNHLQQVAQKAMDLDMDGLMIESHIDPDHALSDAKQQLTPSALSLMLDELQYRSSSSDSKSYNIKLEELRSQIDQIDNEILEALGKRMSVTGEIGHYKKSNEVTIFQIDRWKEILDTRQPFAISNGLSESFTDKFLQLVHDESIRVQTEILNQKK